jgi:hypothetical protein
MTEAEHAPGTTIYHCPLPVCEWTFTQPPPDSSWPVIPVITGESLDGAIGRAAGAIMREWYAEAEEALEAHLSTHTTLEWATEINRLTGLMAKVALDLADGGRIGRSLLTGAMATRANLAREECLDLLREGIASERHQNLASFVAALEQEQGPVSEQELQDIRREWLG